MCKLGISASPRVGCVQIPHLGGCLEAELLGQQHSARPKMGSSRRLPILLLLLMFFVSTCDGRRRWGRRGYSSGGGWPSGRTLHIIFTFRESDQSTQTRMWVEEGVYNNKKTPSASPSVWVNIDLHRRSRRPGHRTDLRDCRCCGLCLRLQLLVLRLLWSLLWDVWIWRPTNSKEHSRSWTSFDIR